MTLTPAVILGGTLVAIIVGLYFLVEQLKKLKLFNKIPEEYRELVVMWLPVILGMVLCPLPFHALNFAWYIGLPVGFGIGLGSGFLFKNIRAVAKVKLAKEGIETPEEDK